MVKAHRYLIWRLSCTILGYRLGRKWSNWASTERRAARMRQVVASASSKSSTCSTLLMGHSGSSYSEEQPTALNRVTRMILSIGSLTRNLSRTDIPASARPRTRTPIARSISPASWKASSALAILHAKWLLWFIAQRRLVLLKKWRMNATTRTLMVHQVNRLNHLQSMSSSLLLSATIATSVWTYDLLNNQNNYLISLNY